MSCQGNSWRSQWKPASAASLHGLLALCRLDLFVEKDVDAEGIDVRMFDRGVGRQVQPGPQQVRGEVGQALELGEELLFAGEVEQRLVDPRANSVALTPHDEREECGERQPDQVANAKLTPVHRSQDTLTEAASFDCVGRNAGE